MLGHASIVAMRVHSPCMICVNDNMMAQGIMRMRTPSIYSFKFVL